MSNDSRNRCGFQQFLFQSSFFPGNRNENKMLVCQAVEVCFCDPALAVYFICLPVCDGHNLLFEFSDGVMMSHAAGWASQSICLQAHESASVSRCSLGGTLLSFLLLTPQDIPDSAYSMCYEGWAISQLTTFLHVA